MRVGRLRQVTPPALAFSIELLSKGTILEGAELAIEEVPAEVRCRGCDRQSALDEFPAACRTCGSLDVEVVRGEELRVDALELDDRASNGDRPAADERTFS